MKVGIRRLLWTVWDALSWMRNEGRGWPLIKNVNSSIGIVISNNVVLAGCWGTIACVPGMKGGMSLLRA